MKIRSFSDIIEVINHPVEAVRDFLRGRSNGRDPDYRPSVAYLRERLARHSRIFPVPAGVEIDPCEFAGRPAEWVRPEGRRAGNAILYLHGGGYVLGSLDTHRHLVAHLVRASRIQALSLDYRLAPEHPFPAAVEDGVAAYRALLEEGFAPDQIVIAGDSAGGGLTLATLLCLRDAGVPLPHGAVCLSPWVDLEGRAESLRANAHLDPIFSLDDLLLAASLYLNGVEPTHPLASPLFADLGGLPPLLIQVGSAEVLRDDSLRLADRAQDCGTPVELDVWADMFHVWHFFADVLPEARRAIRRAAQFIDERIGE